MQLPYICVCGLCVRFLGAILSCYEEDYGEFKDWD